VTVNKHSVYRHQLQKKARKAFRQALNKKGFTKDGTPLEGEEGRKLRTQHGLESLRGALAMTMKKDLVMRLSNAKQQEWRDEGMRILDGVLLSHGFEHRKSQARQIYPRQHWRQRFYSNTLLHHSTPSHTSSHDEKE
jgi:hypothetical protein